MTAPLSVLGDGQVKVTWTPTIADINAPSAAVLNGASAVDLSCYLTADGLTTGVDEQEITDDRLCTTQSFTKPGRFTRTMSLMYVYQPQLPSAADNKAKSTLIYLTTGFITIRWGKAFGSVYIATDVVDVHPVQCGKQTKQPPEANSVLKIAQKILITGLVAEDVAVVA